MTYDIRVGEIKSYEEDGEIFTKVDGPYIFDIANLNMTELSVDFDRHSILDVLNEHITEYETDRVWELTEEVLDSLEELRKWCHQNKTENILISQHLNMLNQVIPKCYEAIECCKKPGIRVF